MFLTADELKSVAYSYQLEDITEGDNTILAMAINSAVEQVKSYLNQPDMKRYTDGRPRYDVAAIFNAAGESRNPLLLELTKSLAVYYILRLANVDIINQKVQDGYDRAVDYLEKVAAVGKYIDSPPLRLDLPLLPSPDPDSDEAKPFRFGSREKFNHDF